MIYVSTVNENIKKKYTKDGEILIGRGRRGQNGPRRASSTGSVVQSKFVLNLGEYYQGKFVPNLGEALGKNWNGQSKEHTHTISVYTHKKEKKTVNTNEINKCVCCKIMKWSWVPK